MTAHNLTKEQKTFLEECQLEFSDRYSDADLDYKKVYDNTIPPPPIMHPWYGRPKAIPRYRYGGGQNSGYRGYNNYENNYRDRDPYRQSDRDRYQDNRRYRNN